MKNNVEDAFIKGILLGFGILGILSGVMWTFTEPTDHWLWFSRFTSGILFLGIYAILKKMDQCGKN